MKIQLKRSNVLTGGFAKEPTASQLEYGELAINYNTDDPAIFLKDSNNNIIRISGIGNIADDGQVELPASTTPPLNPLPGNLWYNSDDGRLYIYYADGDSEQWVDASPDSWDPTILPDSNDDSSQAGTLDDRYLMLNAANDPVTSDLRIDGNLSINSDPIASAQLTVGSSSGTTRMFLDADDGRSEIRVSDGNLRFFTNSNSDPAGNSNTIFYRNGVNESMRIDEDGNVGIGTASPSEALDVVGNIQSDSEVTGLKHRATGISTAGGGGSFGFSSQVTLQVSGGTNSNNVYPASFKSSPINETASLGNFSHYLAQQLTNQSGGTITNQRVFDASVNLTDTATNTYGFVSRLNEGSNTNFNIYASGSAPNYFAGNVGFGTNTPVNRLEVHDGHILVGQASGNSTQERNYVKFGRSSGPKAAIGFENTSTNGRGHLVFMNSIENNGAEFTDDDEVMRINAAGEVGIGTDTPDKKLHVVSSDSTVGTIQSDSSDSALLRFINGSGGNVYIGAKDSNEFSIRTGSDEQVRIDSDGNVGIGTTDPASKLHVRAGNPNLTLEASANSNSGQISFIGKDGSSNVFDTVKLNSTNAGGLVIETDPNDSEFATNPVIVFKQSGVERMRFNPTGYVGIGTNSPTGRLHISHNTAGSALRLQNSNSTDFYYFGVDTEANLRIGKDTDELIRVNSDGTVGIGTNDPESQLHIKGTSNSQNLLVESTEVNSRIEFASSETISTGNRVTVGAREDDFAVNLGAALNTRLLIQPGGNTGIGTTDPAERLDVNGKIRTADGVLFGTDTAGANTLDDYEEGSWTPEYSSSNVEPICTYDMQDGSYTKIGRLVTCIARLRTDSVTGGSGNLRIKNLPFQVQNSHSARGAVTVGLAIAFAGETPTRGIANNNTTHVALYANGATNTANNVTCNVPDLGTGTNANQLYVTFTYITAG